MSGAAPVFPDAPHRPRLFADVQHGLCNRLRVMASCAAVAAATGRELVVIWVPDHHCAARLDELIAYDGPVIEDAGIAALCRRFSAHVYNYLEIEPGAVWAAPVLPDEPPGAGQGDVYIRSADTLRGPHRTLAAEQRFLRALVPTDPVRALVDGVRHPNAVALHVRMATGPGYDHLAHESPANWPEARHRELTEWRRKSHADAFAARLDALIREGRADTVFLAADLAQTYDRFEARYGDRVAMLRRDLFDRSSRQLQYALADLILLTSAELFLASTWSSFSDVAQRLARPGRRMERSGQDF